MVKYKGYEIDYVSSVIRLLVWKDGSIVHDCAYLRDSYSWIDGQSRS